VAASDFLPVAFSQREEASRFARPQTRQSAYPRHPRGMHPAGLRAGPLLKMEIQTQRRLRLSGAGNWKTSLVYVLLSAQWIFAAYETLRSPLPVYREPPGSVVAYALGVIVLTRLAVDAVGFRDRFVLSLGSVRFAMDFLIGVAPTRLQAFVQPTREASLALSVIAAIASASLLRSALDAARLPRSSQ